MDLVAATLVVSLFFGLSYWLGPRIADAMKRLEITLTVAIVAVILIVAGVIYWRHRQTLAQAALEHAAGEDGGDETSTSIAHDNPSGARESHDPFTHDREKVDAVSE